MRFNITSKNKNNSILKITILTGNKNLIKFMIYFNIIIFFFVTLMIICLIYLEKRNKIINNMKEITKISFSDNEERKMDNDLDYETLD